MKSRMLASVMAMLLALALGATGCAPSGARPSEPVGEGGEAYHEEKVALPDDVDELLDVRFAADGGLLAAVRDSGRSRVAVLAECADGTWEERYATDSEQEAGYVSTACLTPKGGLLYLVASADGGQACFLLDGDTAPRKLEGYRESNVHTLRVCDQGTVFALSNSLTGRAGLCRLDAATGERVCSFDLADGEVPSDFVAFDGRAAVATGRGDASGVETGLALFNLETGARETVDPGLAEAFGQVVAAAGGQGPSTAPLLAGGADGLIVCAGGDVYRCDATGAVRIMAGGDTHLATDEVPARLLEQPDGGFLVQFRLLTPTSAGALYRYREGAGKAPSQVLTVYLLENDPDVQQAAATFRDDHPEVGVTVRVGMPEGSGLTADDAVRALNADLLAGTGPDVLVLDGLPLEELAGQGMLLDMTSLLKELTAQDAYYQNVLRAFEGAGGCFALPSRFSVPAAVGQTDLLAHAGSLDELAAFFTAEENRPLLADSLSLSALFLADFPNIAADDGSVDAEALAGFFEGARELLEVSQANSNAEKHGYDYLSLAIPRFGAESSGIGSGSNSMLLDTEKRLTVGMMQAVNDFGRMGVLVESAAYPCSYGLLDFGGGAVFQPEGVLGVNAGTVAPDAASEFVAHVLSKGQQASIQRTGLPVCKAALEDYLAWCGGYGVSFMGDGGESQDFSRGAFTPEEIAACSALLESAVVPVLPGKSLTSAVAAQLEAYCRDETTLEEAVAAVTRETELYRMSS